MKPRANGAFGCFEYSGDLRMGDSLDIKHRYHHSMRFRQRLHCFVQFYLQLIEIRLALRIGFMSGVDQRGILLHRGIQIVQTEAGAAFAFFEEVQGEIHRDLIDPSVEGRVALEFSQGLICAGKDLLQQIVGVLLVGGHVVDEAVKLVAILEDQGIKRAGVALLGTRYEVLVRVGGT